VRSRSYRNANGRAHDLVTDVPFTSWIEDYVHPTPLVPICAPPSDADVQRDIFFAWHAMRLMHRQRRTFRSSNGAAGVTQRRFGVLRSIKYGAEDAKRRREYDPP
jgi:hypothetical protein